MMGVSVAIHQFKVPPIMMGVAESVGLHPDKAPMLMSVFMLVCLVFAVPAGALVERMQAKSVLLLAAAIVAAGSVAGALSNSAGALLFTRGIEGLGFLIMSIAVPVAAVSYANPKRIGLVMGICGVWISVGSIVAFNSVPVLSRHTGRQGIWWVFAIFTVAAIIVFMVFFKGKKENNNNEVKSNVEKKPKKGLGDAVKNKNLIFASTAYLIYNFNLMAMITFFPVFAVSAGLMDLGKASFTASLPMIISLLGSPIMGRLADSLGHKWLLCISMFCAGIGVTLMFVKSTSLIMAGAVILGLIGATTPALMFSSLGKLIPDKNLIAQSNGIVVLFQNMGMFLASFFFAGIAKTFGGSFTLAGMVLIPFTIVSVLLIFFTNYKSINTD